MCVFVSVLEWVFREGIILFHASMLQYIFKYFEFFFLVSYIPVFLFFSGFQLVCLFVIVCLMCDSFCAIVGWAANYFNTLIDDSV